MLRDCDNAEMRDRLPDLLHGRLAGDERARVEAHVASCADCSAELALLRDARVELSGRGRAVNVARIAEAVNSGRGRVLVVRRPTLDVGRAKLIAAAAVVAIAGATLVLALKARDDTGQPVREAPVAVTPAPDTVAGPRTASTETRAAGVERRASSISFGGGLSDLTEEELESLAAALESAELAPGAEPVAVEPIGISEGV